jgi:hypothetical protein
VLFKHLVIGLVLSACGDGRSAPLVQDASPPPADTVVAPPPIDAPAAGCAQSSDCEAGAICHWAPQHACGLDHGRGSCNSSEAQLCPDLAFFVCGCDGQTYINQCVSDSQLVDVAYGGPCRPDGVYTPCTTSADCPTDLTFHQFCVDDPRDACDPANGDTDCPGLCVHANQTCSDAVACSPTGAESDIDSPDTQTCIALVGADPDADPGACVFTTRVRCASALDCGSGEVCSTDRNCTAGEPCLGWCVRP